MSTFAVTIKTVTIEPHPNADALELARFGGYCAVVRKGAHRTGDAVVWIPEEAVIPDALLEELGLVGRLAGKAHNRVKATRLRGVLSQGLIMPLKPGWTNQTDLATELGITRHSPAVPIHMAGEAYAAGMDRTLSYDIENIKAHPDVFDNGELVSITEKIHGTWCQIGWMPERLAHPEHGRLIVASKGIAAQGLALKPHAEANAHNLYLRAAREWELERRMKAQFEGQDEPVFLLAEVFGEGVQDLGYGQRRTGAAPPGLRAFDVRIGGRGTGRWLNDVELESTLWALGVPRVPVLYRGPFDQEVLHAYTVGRETVSGNEMHVREGVVVRPLTERRDLVLGRVQCKSINTAYLLRKGGSEFH